MNNRQSVFSSNSDTNPVIKALEDKSFVMTILCNDCYKHYNFCKQICIVLIIITSSIMVLLNTYDPKIYWIQYVNIIMNSINIIVISFQSKFEIVEKH